MQNYAVIDLGTNTFHLLIVQRQADGTISNLYRESRFVKLGENGVKTIGKAPYNRGINTLIDYKKILDQYEIEGIRACGTAALRTASNGAAFVQEVKEKINLEVTLIDGSKEAHFIYKGIRQAVPLTEKSLLMDIGGGSVEFIIADQEKIYWAESFPVGVSVLRNTFHNNEPISNNEINELEQHIDTILSPLMKSLKMHHVSALVGASGTFDILEKMIKGENLSTLYTVMDAAKFQPLYNKFLKSTLTERLNTPDLPKDRADMIVVALILIEYIIKKAGIEQIITSAYAMKEGILQELMED